MPRYFFHTQNGYRVEDERGCDLHDLEAAKQHALAVLSELLRGRSSSFWETDEFKVTVTDAQGLDLLTLYVGVSYAPAVGG